MAYRHNKGYAQNPHTSFHQKRLTLEQKKVVEELQKMGFSIKKNTNAFGKEMHGISLVKTYEAVDVYRGSQCFPNTPIEFEFLPTTSRKNVNATDKMKEAAQYQTAEKMENHLDVIMSITFTVMDSTFTSYKFLVLCKDKDLYFKDAKGTITIDIIDPSLLDFLSRHGLNGSYIGKNPSPDDRPINLGPPGELPPPEARPSTSTTQQGGPQ